jgi:pilus assembly protein Flp/PilA
MSDTLRLARSLIVDDAGATLVEYSLVIGLIALLSIAAVSFLGNGVKTFFSTVGNSISGS